MNRAKTSQTRPKQAGTHFAGGEQAETGDGAKHDSIDHHSVGIHVSHPEGYGGYLMLRCVRVHDVLHIYPILKKHGVSQQFSPMMATTMR